MVDEYDLFEQIVEGLVMVSESGFEISYSTVILGVTFYFVIIEQWMIDSPLPDQHFETKDEALFEVGFLMNILPLSLATIEYQIDTIYSDATKSKRIAPMLVIPAFCFMIWNYYEQKYKYDKLI
jgi:hypothetical protein